MSGENGGNAASSCHVYIHDKAHEWIPALLLSSDEGGGSSKKIKGPSATVLVQHYNDEKDILHGIRKSAKKTTTITVGLTEYENLHLPLQNVDDHGKLKAYEDMVNLPYLHEAAILFNLKYRHGNGLPYTRTGDIVVAMNPYQWINQLYTEKKRNLYAQKLLWDKPTESDPRSTLAPHVYEVSALSYKGLAMDHENQSILVSGESGAGKTETVKICMNHIANVQRGPIINSAEEADGGSANKVEDDAAAKQIVQRVLDSNPLLEAFGNAKTRRNDNSSRFGKFLQLQFDKDQMSLTIKKSKSEALLAGSMCEVYLLEKNRITAHDCTERGFHIFYQLLASHENEKSEIWKDGLSHTSNESFKYVGPTDTDTIEGICDGERFQLTKKTLELIGVGGEEFSTLMRAMCVVLQLGNIIFDKDGDDDDVSVIKSIEELEKLSNLMGIPKDELTKSLTRRTVKASKEVYEVPLNPENAKDSADAFAKEIYGRLFLWIVQSINKATCAQNNYIPGGGFNTVIEEYGTIGLLDIFGFESFDINRFEQLCINYANEKLQHKFTEDIFENLQREYEYEGIPLAEVAYDDNTNVLSLIEGRNGLLSILNDECLRPKGNAAEFVHKALRQMKNKNCIIKNKTDQISFGISHFAGVVFYDASDFVSRNLDTLAKDLLDCGVKSSNNHIIQYVFETELDVSVNGTSSSSTTKPRSGNGRPNSNTQTIASATVWTKYKSQLSKLMANVRSTQTRYIRCIKPNPFKKALLLDHKLTVEQLRSAGIVAGVTITRSAFPNRIDNETVYKRYKAMWNKNKYPGQPFPRGDYSESDQISDSEKRAKDVEALLSVVLKAKTTVDEDGKEIKGFVVGKTRTYFRKGALETLESNRQKGLDIHAITMQKIIRSYLCRLRHQELLRKKLYEERLERERVAAEERARVDRLAREKEERNKERQKELDKLYDEIDELNKLIIQSDEKKIQKIKEFEERKLEAKRLKLEYEDKMDGIIKQLEKAKVATRRNSSIIEMNKNMINELKRANKDMMKGLGKITKKVKRISMNNESLRISAEESESQFDPDDLLIIEKNDDLQREADEIKVSHEQLKDDVGDWQDKYWKKASARLNAQKNLARILNLVQRGCKDSKILRRVNTVVSKLEKETNMTMIDLESEYGSKETTTVQPGLSHGIV